MTENGQLIFDTESEINLYLTSLELSDEKVIELYHNHAVCEQYHSEIKTDMDVERLPSGKFDTNALILKLAMLAYNILRIIGTEAMMKHDMPIRHSHDKTSQNPHRHRQAYAYCRALDGSCEKIYSCSWTKQSLGKYIYQNI